ncbi:MAG: hypothetical protein J6O18_02280 [Bacilli bacterium]|nr:hypothetical protein [Bacilli bacterium]
MKDSLKTFISACGYSVSSLSAALKYNNMTFIHRLDDYDKDPNSLSDLYLKGVFDFLFLKEDGKTRVNPIEFSIRYPVVLHFLSNVNASNLDGVLKDDDLKEFLLRGAELEKKYAATGDEPIYLGPSDTFRKRILDALDDKRIRIIPAKHEKETVSYPYIIFTTEKLHQAILPPKESRRIWQNVQDPFYFTIYVDPNQQRPGRKGLLCELWFYGSKNEQWRWKELLEKEGLTCDQMHENYMRCAFHPFIPDLKTIGQQVLDYLPTILEYEDIIIRKNQ